MYSFHIRSVIVALVVVLTQKFTLAFLEDVNNKQAVSIEVATSFLKVPWIDFQNTLKDGVASQCRNDIANLFESASAGEMWALQMLDAASGIPSGILMGNIIDLGAYDECVRVKAHKNSATIQGQHCMVSLTIPSKFVRNASKMLELRKLSILNPTAHIDLSLTLSVCLPSSCSVENVVDLVNASIKRTSAFSKFEISIAGVKCSDVQSMYDVTMGTILAISFFVAIASLLLSCTVCDFLVRTGSGYRFTNLKTLAKFSPYTNAMKLISTEISPGSMPVINGIRFISTCSIIICHKGVLTLMNPLVNLSDLHKFRQTLLSSFYIMLPYTVDTFFVISGFLVARSFRRKFRSGIKRNILQFYLHRYIRLMPCIGILMLFIVFVVPYFGSGPIWQSLLREAINHCGIHWWSNLLFVQNFAARGEMCIPHTWSVAVEMQFYVLSPIILYPLFHRPKLGLTMLSLLLIASFITPAIQILLNDYSFLFNSTKSHAVSFVDFFNSYTMTYNRALPYLVGIFLGYDMVNNKRRITKMQAVSNWILACIFILFCFRHTYFIQPNAFKYDAISEAMHVSFGRLGWSLAIAWIIYACTQGYGGPIARFLSLPIFIPLSRLSYAIYLVHFLIQVGINATKRTPEFYTTFTVFYLAWSDLTMSIAIAFVLNICIETPAITLEEVLLGQRPAAITNRVLAKNKENLTAIINEYLDLITKRRQVSSDSVMEMKMPQIDFGRHVSDLLNALRKRPASKTPAEGTNTRWGRKNDKRETPGKDIYNELTQFETRVETLERELIIFFISMTYGLDNEADFKELVRFCQQKLQDFHEKALVRSSTSDLTLFMKKAI